MNTGYFGNKPIPVEKSSLYEGPVSYLKTSYEKPIRLDL
jgi:hypothetical protein